MYSNHLNTGIVLYSDVSGCQMVRILNGGLKTGLKKSLLMVQNVWYLNGPPSHVALPFEYGTLKLFSIQIIPVFRCWLFR